jgi:dihydrofolate reductase
MRKLISSTFVSLDGVMQAPGGPDEDRTGGFEFGGWIAPYGDEATGATIGELFSAPFDLVLGRKTYDIFAAYWPFVQTDPSANGFNAFRARLAEKFNRATKHVATHSPAGLSWQNSRSLGPDVVASLQNLKRQDGPVLLVQGSSELLHTLFAHDLIDEFQLLIHPVVLGRGKRLFDAGSAPAAFKLTHSAISRTGVVIARYERAGDVQARPLAPDTPSATELERRKNQR